MCFPRLSPLGLPRTCGDASEIRIPDATFLLYSFIFPIIYHAATCHISIKRKHACSRKQRAIREKLTYLQGFQLSFRIHLILL